ncbi:MAG: indolepyruvate ferredoxin oxidoreductase subunit alpha [Candidatus Fermentithermobacillus carboniphilus]|uniref:Indolepyruvate oxidoreductase subunit IorA n=1 Tax=Candidatus Fermentithermobacillus carboniphilus TaxID=3085328 RepID=A0AAT9LEF1_9FIRM|nr:MAG: indolepyruvate ferredoxin oxidoreductase subunit alpha [Candidatus Fermentithermobacillus carboniphilus]
MVTQDTFKRTSDSNPRLLYGNEAIALGAYEAGCTVAAGYPGTPSTEIIETMTRFPDIHVEWSTNEKVALEVVIGASIAGVRAIACMKHVGLNVAADPLMTVTYMGVRGGLVIVTADDPGMHSSQNEQDNRWFGKFAKVPILEPSDSQEAYDFTRVAFDISEEFDTPVIIRSTTRISHARSLVATSGKKAVGRKPYEKDMAKYVMLPANARRRKVSVLERVKKLAEFSDEAGLNRIEWGDDYIGFITGGISYQYVKEAFPEASVLKLGLAYPLPEKVIREFAARVKCLYVVEELDDFWETQIRAMGITCRGKDVFPGAGELSVGIVKQKVLWSLGCTDPGCGEKRGDASGGGPSNVAEAGLLNAAEPDLVPGTRSLPARPPVLCPGCPHRAVYYVIKKLGLVACGDIGCYTLGALPPLSSLDTTTCMGASIGHAQGMRLGLPADKAGKVVAVIGDSTFMHSGITPLINMTYNQVDAPVIILDNGTTAMTGHQGHPASGWNARHKESPKVAIEEIARAVGRRDVEVVDAYDTKSVERALRKALDQPSAVIIARAPCVLLARKKTQPVKFDLSLCVECGLCLRPGCPALEREGRKPKVNEILCTGCGLCVQICPRNALFAGAKGECPGPGDGVTAVEGRREGGDSTC